MWMTHPQVPPLPPCFAKVTITIQTTLIVHLCFPLPQEPTPLRSSVRPGCTKTDVTHPVLGWGGANVRLQHQGRIPNCSEVPDTCFLWYFVQFFFFFSQCAPRAIFSVGAPTLTRGFLHWPLGKTLGIHPVGAWDIAWDSSGALSGYRLAFIRWPLGKSLGIFRWPLRRSPSIFGIALGVSEHVPRHFSFKLPGHLDIRSKAMERHVVVPSIHWGWGCVRPSALKGLPI